MDEFAAMLSRRNTRTRLVTEGKDKCSAILRSGRVVYRSLKTGLQVGCPRRRGDPERQSEVSGLAGQVRGPRVSRR